MTDETQTMTITYDLLDMQFPKPSKWQNADWLSTIGTVLEQGTFKGVDGNEIEYERSVVDALLTTAVNKPIHLFHRNREDNLRDIGRVFGVYNEGGKGKIKYITWNGEANAGLKKGEYKLSMEAKVITLEKNREKRQYKAIGGEILGVSLVYNAAIPTATNEQVSAVALEKEKEKEIENSANAEPGIRFPKSAQLSEKELSPCITLLEKHGFTMSKGVTTVTNEKDKEPIVDPKKKDEKEVIQEKDKKPPAPEVTEPVVEEPTVSLEQFQAMQAKMADMEKTMEKSAGKIATLEGTDMQTIKDKVLAVSPKADFKILLGGEENVESQKRILNAHLSGLALRDSPDVNLEGVDVENEGEKPDPKEIEAQYMKSYLGFEENPLAVKDEGGK
ncbi:hypothetical protein KAR91_56860 [Candidatus Pacearchaeota archaeon]|nr:hypothetical protein [Candidatus Pacearchaeota archaeon]